MKFKDYLEESEVTPEQQNWKRIEAKMDMAVNSLSGVLPMLTKKGPNDRELRKLMGNLNTLKEKIRMDSRR